MESDPIVHALRDLGTRESSRGSRVLADDIIRAGRRRIRIRRGVAATLVAVAVAGISLAIPAVRHISTPPAVPVPVTCVESMLAVPPGASQVLVTVGDPTGRYLAGTAGPAAGPADNPTGYSVGVLWTAGHPVTFPITGGHADIADVSAHGAVIGDRRTTNGFVGWIWADGKIADLTGANATPKAINGLGEIVGYTTSDASAQLIRSTPVLWLSPTASAQSLRLPDGYTGGQATDIDEDGTILGIVTDGVGIRPAIWLPNGRPVLLHGQPVLLPDGRPMRLPEGLPVLLPMPADASGVLWMAGVSVRDGTVVVEFATADTTPGIERGMALEYTVSTGRYRMLPRSVTFSAGGDEDPSKAPPTTGWFPGAANGSGWMVGSGVRSEALLYTPGTGFMLLPSESGPDSPGELGGAVAASLSDDGAVIGGLDHVRGTRIVSPVMWTCH